MPSFPRVSHVLGLGLGVVLWPITFACVLRNRRARAFHPDGSLYTARFIATDTAAERLAGPALVRLAATFVRDEVESPDVIGLAVRFGTSSGPARPADAQDVLTATFDGFLPAQLARGKATTNVHDFLDNDYRAIAPFVVPEAGIAYLRFRGVRRAAPSGAAASRRARLEAAISDGGASFELELAPLARPSVWRPLGRLDLQSPIEISQKQLAFSPFHSGRGIRPTGLLNGLRRANYWLSRFMRGGSMR